MVDLLDKDILEAIDRYASPEKVEGFERGPALVPISATELKQRLKYNVSTEVVESRLRRLEEEEFLRSEGGKWRLTFKGKMLLEDFWDTLSRLKIVEEVEKAPSKMEAPSASPPSASPELNKGPEDIGARPLETTRKRAAKWFTVGFNKGILFVSTGVAFLATGILLIAKIYYPPSILILGLDAWIFALALGVVLALSTSVYVSLRSSKR